MSVLLVAMMFQSPIGWGLSCEAAIASGYGDITDVSIPYWLGSKLRDVRAAEGRLF